MVKEETFPPVSNQISHRHDINILIFKKTKCTTTAKNAVPEVMYFAMASSYSFFLIHSVTEGHYTLKAIALKRKYHVKS